MERGTRFLRSTLSDVQRLSLIEYANGIASNVGKKEHGVQKCYIISGQPVAAGSLPQAGSDRSLTDSMIPNVSASVASFITTFDKAKPG